MGQTTTTGLERLMASRDTMTHAGQSMYILHEDQEGNELC